MKTPLRVLGVLLLVYMMITGFAVGQVPQLINYQGVLVDPGRGQPVPDSTYTIAFSIYDVASGSIAIWTETQDVQTKDGLYNALLGSTTPLTPTILSGPEKYLGIKVGSDPEMTPRKRIVSVAYALIAESVSGASNLFPSDGNVGIGDISPTNKLDVAGKIGINDIQLIYLPDQTDFEGTLYLGDGGSSLSHSSGWGGSYNTAIGIGALYANTMGNYNTVSGYQALYSNTTGTENTASGYQALYSNTIGLENTASGYGALYFNTEGDGNTASGRRALYSNTTGRYSTANGVVALASNTTGNYNTANGYNSLVSNTTGSYNTASGYRALRSNTTGSYNTASGNYALHANTTGNFNTAIGDFANVGYGDLHNATAIGKYAFVNASNKVVIGATDVTVIGGYVNWSNLSDSRFKRSVQEDIKGLDFITRLRPVSYKLDIMALNTYLGVKSDPEHEYVSNSNKGDIVYSGFIGQEVEAAAREVGYDFSGVVPPQNEKDHYSLRYAEFVVPLVKGMQEQQKMIEQMQNRIAELEKRLEK